MVEALILAAATGGLLLLLTGRRAAPGRSSGLNDVVNRRQERRVRRYDVPLTFRR